MQSCFVRLTLMKSPFSDLLYQENKMFLINCHHSSLTNPLLICSLSSLYCPCVYSGTFGSMADILRWSRALHVSRTNVRSQHSLFPLGFGCQTFYVTPICNDVTDGTEINVWFSLSHNCWFHLSASHELRTDSPPLVKRMLVLGLDWKRSSFMYV